MTEVPDLEAVTGEVERLRPAELIVDEEARVCRQLDERARITRRPPWHFELDSATRLLCSQFGTRDLSGFGCEDLPRGIVAAGALLQYVTDTQKTELPHLQSISVERREDAVIMDAPTRRNLEIEASLTGHHEFTLAGVMDRCQSPMGSRLLRRWLQRPLRDPAILRGRYQAIEALQQNSLVDSIQTAIDGVGDVERILSRVALRSARPRDLTTAVRGIVALAGAAPADRSLWNRRRSLTCTSRSDEHRSEFGLLDKAVIDSPPMLIRDGGVIADGYDVELDDLRAIAANADQYLLDLETREKERTRHRNAEARLQPRAWLLHRDQQGSG